MLLAVKAPKVCFQGFFLFLTALWAGIRTRARRAAPGRFPAGCQRVGQVRPRHQDIPNVCIYLKLSVRPWRWEQGTLLNSVDGRQDIFPRIYWSFFKPLGGGGVKNKKARILLGISLWIVAVPIVPDGYKRSSLI